MINGTVLTLNFPGQHVQGREIFVPENEITNVGAYCRRAKVRS
jgi:hypothetical protein